MVEKSLASALLEYHEGAKELHKLNPQGIKSKAEEDIALATIIAEETEAERDRRRGTDRDFEVLVGGLLGGVGRYVDTLHWDHFIDEEAVYLRCAMRAKLPAFEVIKFVCEKCSPNNSRAMMWLWFYLHERELFQKHYGLTLEVSAGLLREQKAKMLEAARVEKSENATKAINARHDQPNGYRDKKKAVVAAWETGKYKTKTECAGGMSTKLGISFDTARKALREKRASTS
jgi:hypothetical protein